MFKAEVYSERRKKLKQLVKTGIIYLPGNNEAPMNYPANTYLFRQDSSFLYYFGLDADGISGIIDVDADKDIIFADDRSVDDVVWMGYEKSFNERAKLVGVTIVKPVAELNDVISKAVHSGRKIHYLPQYRAESKLQIEKLIGIHHSRVNDHSSKDFILAVIEQRSVKSDEEVKQIESAVDISYEMNTAAMKFSKPGLKEREVFGIIEGIASSKGRGISFPSIFSIHGEILHNHHHENLMKDGDLLVLDSGAESELHYASDITRSFPVNGKFSQKQKDIYNIVLKSQVESIEMMKPGVKFKEVHLKAAKIIASGLIDLGLMKGTAEDAVKEGAHALFFPHGLGHMLGLDVHDMEGLGEGFVGYDKDTSRSDQFGLAYLRLAKELKPGFTVTVEPGIYFIPQLFEHWKKDNKHSNFVNYGKVEEYIGFGGVRIEDDVLVTDSGFKVLGSKPIPKSIAEVESACAKE